MGCNTSKHAAANNTAIDPRYDAQGNLVITHSTSSLKLKKSGSSFSQDVDGNLDVTTIPVDDLLRGSHKSFHKTKPERLFLLLAKALHQQEQPRGGGGEAGPIDPDVFDDLITERQALYVAVIDQIQRQEKDDLNNNTTSSTTNTSSSHKKRHSRKKQRIPPARYVHPTTQQTPLHLACQLVDVDQNQVSAKELCRVMDGLLRTYPEALVWKDVDGHVPLHYAIAPNHIRANHMNAKITTTTDGTIIVSTTTQEESEDHPEDAEPPSPTATTPVAVENHPATTEVDRDEEDWRARGIFVQHLFHSNLPAAHEYWQQSDVLYDEGAGGRRGGGIGSKSTCSNGGCSPLYRVLQTLPDDFDRSGPTVDYIKVLLQASYSYAATTTNENSNNDNHNHNNNTNTNNHNNMAGIGNASDGDKPLGLLYRRFTRQFDISEMFFPGDNSRSAVVRHREQYKYAAGNTWKIIEALLKPPSQYVTHPSPATAGSQDTESNRSLGLVPSGSSAYSPSNQEAVWGLVHRAVQMETPPDLLRYIVETNAHDLTKVDGAGNLPLHYAAMVKPPNSTINKRHNYRSSSGALTVGITNVITNTTTASHFPSFYTKYVVDELLYKFPDAASMTNAEGKFPLELAVTSGKQWIGGGIKSLYDAYPKALQQIDLQQRHNQSLRQALSMGGEETEEGTNHNNNSKNKDNNNTKYDDEGNIVEGEEAGAMQQLTNDEKLLKQATMTSQYTTGSATMTNDDDDDDEDAEGIIKDEHHDAIMLVQQSDVDFREVAIAMWAHEEDAGVQMLGCCAIVRLLDDDNNRTMQTTSNDDDNNIQDSDNTDEKNAKTLRIALTATASVVNAMKAHPNEMIVQEKACRALQFLAPADGRREVSMVASGAVASVVAAMQAHVGDASVQEEACAAIGAIVKHGGGDRATVVASVSGVTAILNAIAAHPREVKVQQQGLNALWQLTNFDANDASMPELPRAQTEPLLAQAKEVFPNECNELVVKLSDRMKE